MTLAPASAPGVRLRRARRGGDGVVRVRTDVAGFVGYAKRGPVGVPVRVRTMRAFEGIFGGYHDAGFLAYAARGFFENGGDTLLAVRVASPLPDIGADRARAVLPGASGAPLVEVTAGSAGVWGNGLSVALTPARRIETVVSHPPITATTFDLAAARGVAAPRRHDYERGESAPPTRVIARHGFSPTSPRPALFAAGAPGRLLRAATIDRFIMVGGCSGPAASEPGVWRAGADGKCRVAAAACRDRRRSRTDTADTSHRRFSRHARGLGGSRRHPQPLRREIP